MGKGSVYSYSSTQKLVSRSSTEAEVIGVDDLMPQMMWTGYFLKAQGVAVVDTLLYQDNKSSMLLEKNGRASSGKRTRHIDIRFYFVADRVASGDLRIEHCPTEEMLADYFTKPLQGALFYRLRDQIMNIDPSSTYHSSSSCQRSVLVDPDSDLETPVPGAQNISQNVLEALLPAAEKISYRDIVVRGKIDGERTSS